MIFELVQPELQERATSYVVVEVSPSVVVVDSQIGQNSSCCLCAYVLDSVGSALVVVDYDWAVGFWIPVWVGIPVWAGIPVWIGILAVLVEDWGRDIADSPCLVEEVEMGSVYMGEWADDVADWGADILGRATYVWIWAMVSAV